MVEKNKEGGWKHSLEINASDFPNNSAEMLQKLASGKVYGYSNVYPESIRRMWAPDFTVVTEFEKKIAEFFGAPFGIAVDSCTHGIELCLRYENAKWMWSEIRTYLSIPMLATKLNIELRWEETNWQDQYFVYNNIIDAAVLWKANSYIPGYFQCISFQYQKHLSLGRGGMILCDNEQDAIQLKKMSYDGRVPGIPWREQDIDTMGYHYYMTPETAQLGLIKLPNAIDTKPRQWSINDWPDISKFKIFQKT